jgi:hypothetical protein
VDDSRPSNDAYENGMKAAGSGMKATGSVMKRNVLARVVHRCASGR